MQQETIKEQFIAWLHHMYHIGNDHQLVELMEDTDVQAMFLELSGLPEDTEL